MGGMVNTGALLINVVTAGKPKMLTGLGQKGTVAGTGSCFSPVMDTERYRRIESTSPVTVNLVERGKPVSFLSQERSGSRKANQRRGEYGGGKKRRPPCNGVDTGCNMTRRASGQTSLRCLGTSTREESTKKVWHMSVALWHWCSLPLSLSARASCPGMSHGAERGIDFRRVSCSQRVASPLTGPSHGL